MGQIFTEWEKHLTPKKQKEDEKDSTEDTILKGIFSFSGPGGMQGGPEQNMARYKALQATGELLGDLWKKNIKK